MVHVSTQQEFSDADWRAVATADQSKKLKLLLSGLTTGTTRVWTASDKDGTVLLSSDLAANVLSFLGTPSSANLRAALTDETGTGAAVFAGGNIGAATATSLSFGGTAISSFVEGTVTPTLTAVTNVAASTAFVSRYVRFNDTVLQWGVFNMQATAAAGANTVLGLSLAVATNLTTVNLQDVAGFAIPIGQSQRALAILADITNDRASVRGNAEQTNNTSYYYGLIYPVI